MGIPKFITYLLRCDTAEFGKRVLKFRTKLLSRPSLSRIYFTEIDITVVLLERELTWHLVYTCFSWLLVELLPRLWPRTMALSLQWETSTTQSVSSSVNSICDQR